MSQNSEFATSTLLAQLKQKNGSKSILQAQSDSRISLSFTISHKGLFCDKPFFFLPKPLTVSLEKVKTMNVIANSFSKIVSYIQSLHFK